MNDTDQHVRGVKQVFGKESTAVIAGLPSLQDSTDFFQTQSAGPADGSLEPMEQDNAASTSQADAAAQAMEDTEIAAANIPAANKPAGQLFFTVNTGCRCCMELDCSSGMCCMNLL